MCGVCGFIEYGPALNSKKTIDSMVEKIKHRGPDHTGIYLNNNLALGHTRLAILDLSANGNQPMESHGGGHVLAYNGEIYNFKELRQELEKLGVNFVGNSDSEVVVQAWEKWGKSCVKRFNGMFSFVIYSKKDHKIYLARDRYGIKPLYFGFFGQTLIFGSEIKSFVSHPAFKPEVNYESLVTYLTFQNQINVQTLFKGIEMVPAGTVLEFSTQVQRFLSEYKYWDFHFEKKADYFGFEEAKEEVFRLLSQAVNRQLVSDVEVGSYLSGGMDSSTIASIAVKSAPELKTFTVGFDVSTASGLELGFDERSIAKSLATSLGTTHFDTQLKSGDMEASLNALVFALDEPRVGQSYPNFYAARLARSKVKVVMSGAGGDELFGGYPWRYFYSDKSMTFNSFTEAYYKKNQRLIPNSNLRKILKPINHLTKDVWTLDLFRKVFNDKVGADWSFNSSEDFLNASLYYEAKTFLHGLLVVEDKLSMACGLESRLPFLDNDVVDFAMAIPPEYKVTDLKSMAFLDENDLKAKNSKKAQLNSGKFILRESMRGRLPEYITSGLKQGFSGPDGSWFKGESLDFLQKSIGGNDARIYEYLDRREVSEIIQEHMSGAQNRRLFLWSLLNLESWLKQFIH